MTLSYRMTYSIVAALFFLVAICTAYLGLSLMRDPKVDLLFGYGGADWLRPPQESGPGTHGAEDFMAAYRTFVEVNARPAEAMLHVYPYRFVEVYVNGEGVFATDGDLDQWKQRHTFDLATVPSFVGGRHEIVLSVINRTGPPMVLAYCPELNIGTGTDWEVKTREHPEWVPASSWRDPQINTIGTETGSVAEAMRRWWPLYVLIFGLACTWTVVASRASSGIPEAFRSPSASSIRWLVLCAWAVLVFNNITRLPYGVGFDVEGHIQYMAVIARKGRIPYAHEGWQMFQSPLYYLISAPLYTLFNNVWSIQKTPELLRVVPMVCGAAMVEITYRTLRVVFPERIDVQRWGTVLGGLLPINIYLSQNLANEPMAAVFTALVMLAAFYLLRARDGNPRYGMWLLLGLALGASLLTKVTAVLLVPVLGLLLLYVALRNAAGYGDWARRTVISSAIVSVSAFVVCGWYFVYNYIEMGRPFVGGWDESRGYIWWQEPGYRDIRQYFVFGQSLVYPIYSAVHGFWDGLYSTLWLDGFAGSHVQLDKYAFWNFDFLLHAAWFSILPTLLILTGGLRSVVRWKSSIEDGTLWAAAALAIFVAAMAYLSFTIASFSTVKASYTLGLAPCYAILFGAGYQSLPKHIVVRSVINGLMACWAVSVFWGYLVLPD